MVPVVPSMVSVGCLPYPSGLKLCLRGAPPTNPCPVRPLQNVSLTHPGWNGAYRISTHKQVPSMLYTGCFSYTSRLKWCLWRTLTNPCPSQYLLDVSLTYPGWNCAYTEPLSQTHAQYALWEHVSISHSCWIGAYRNPCHELIPSMFSNGSFS